MASYKMDYAVRSPARSPTFVDFSPDGRFLAVGDQAPSSLHLLDRRNSFYKAVGANTSERPTAMVWENSWAFYVGLADGCFTYYRIDLRSVMLVKGILRDGKLVQGVTNHSFRGVFPITAMALDAESKTLVISVGPEVFAFRRIHATSDFCLVTKLSSQFRFIYEPGRLAPPFPRTICFTSNNTLVMTFCRQNIVSTYLEFGRDQRLSRSFRTAEIDYSGLPLLKAVTSADGEERLTRCWIYGNTLQSGDCEYPFLFINGGAATLSSTRCGTAIIKDAVTQRTIQELDHSGPGVDGRVSFMAYYISDSEYNIVTADRGEDPLIKVWTAKKASNPQGLPHRGFIPRKTLIVVVLAVLLLVTIQRQMGRVPNIGEISWAFSQIVLSFIQSCTEIGYIIRKTAKDFEDFLRNVLD